jgi:hypothetical protein
MGDGLPNGARLATARPITEANVMIKVERLCACYLLVREHFAGIDRKTTQIHEVDSHTPVSLSPGQYAIAIIEGVEAHPYTPTRIFP